MEDYRRCTFSGGGEERSEILPISIEKESIKRAWNIWKVEDSWTRSPNIWGRGGRREEKTRQSFGRCFNGRVRIVRKGWVGKSSQRQLRPRSSSWRAKCFPLWREGGGGLGRCEWSKKASAEYNNYFTSDLRGPGNWNFRATPGTKAALWRALALGTEHFQLWHYNLLPVPRGECARLLPAQIILI